ncbi:MAG: glycosyltransferase family 39 protein [Deltaproteobacteria bacterium]|nr:glycosyltransferase family 39 protein [Deltaproteobacteria bacterium]
MKKTIIALALVVVLGAVFRLSGLNWDQGHHLHADERFLTMVETSMKWPSHFKDYFDEAHSPLNPRNVGHGFFVYGTWPTTMVKAASILLGKTGYDQVELVGRTISALLDLGTVLLVFLLAVTLYRDKRLAVLAAAFYAASVLPIQLAHFFTVDTFANFFVMAALVCLARLQVSHRFYHLAAAACFGGLALACKTSIFPFFFLLILVVVYSTRTRPHPTGAPEARIRWVARLIISLLMAGLVSLIAFRLAEPDAFRGPGFFGLWPSERWLQNTAEIIRMTQGYVDWPPNDQWTDCPIIWSPFKNMVLWGLGLPLGITASIAFLTTGWRLGRHKDWSHLIPVIWTGMMFFYLATQWVKYMRYLLPIYPTLAILAAWLIIRVWEKSGILRPTLQTDKKKSWLVTAAAGLLIVSICAGTLAWAVAFFHIYTRPHSRVQASRWIYRNIPAGSVIANEHWDEGLPLEVDGQGAQPRYRIMELANYDDDTPQKLEQTLRTLDQTDYIILSSSRLYTSIPKLPPRYPMTIRYYQTLFSGELGFVRVADVTSYPYLLGLTFPDDQAEETFSVFDHPRVIIFKKTSAWNKQRARLLLGTIDWKNVYHLTPREAANYKNRLMIDPKTFEADRRGGTWSRVLDPRHGLFDVHDLANRWPALIWILSLEIIGFLTWPLLALALPNLADKGWMVAKTAGLLVISYGAWLLAGFQIMAFSRWSVGLVTLVIGLATVAAAWIQRRTWGEFWRHRWRLILGEEVLFLAFFALFLGIRWLNPDLWHPYFGGEKPMDFAFLNAVVKSSFSPPYNPWFAGGYINYYYFGYVQIAALIHRTGIIPAVAYNLAIPTLFALTTAGAFTVVYNLADASNAIRPSGAGPAGRPDNRPGSTFGYGCLGAIFVAIIGNLDEVRLFFKGLSEMSQIQLGPGLAWLLPIVRPMHGLYQAIVHGQALAISNSALYWDATRAIPHPPTEAVPITEFPFFTFLYGDIHPHLLAFPVALLALVLAVQYVKSARPGRLPWDTRVFPKTQLWAGPDWAETLTLGLTGLTVGALWPTNAWDYPTYLMLVGLAVGYAQMGRGRLTGLSLNWRVIWATAWRILVIFGASKFFFLPYTANYAQPYGELYLWPGSKTPLSAYLTIHGFFLFFLITFLLVTFFYAPGLNFIVRYIRLYLGYVWTRPRRLRRLMDRLIWEQPSYYVIMSLLAAALILALIAVVTHQAAIVLAAGVGMISTILFFSPGISPALRLSLTFILAGVGLTILVEVVALKGDAGRMNTVFKFYLQAWILWALAAATGLSAIVQQWLNRPRRRPNLCGTVIRELWIKAGILLLIGVLCYPILATSAKCRDRFVTNPPLPPTLDGMYYMSQAFHSQENRIYDLSLDYRAIRWIQENISGSPVMLEGFAPRFSWASRVSIYTGLPTVIGWDSHIAMQRASLLDNQIGDRINDVAAIYRSPDPRSIIPLLKRYQIDYIYVGQLERQYYPGPGLNKFDTYLGRYWDLVYMNPGVSIYRVKP